MRRINKMLFIYFVQFIPDIGQEDLCNYIYIYISDIHLFHISEINSCNLLT